MGSFAKTALGVGVPFGVVMGAFFTWLSNWSSGLTLGVFCGVLFGSGIALFARWQGRSAPTGELTPGEPIEHGGPANHVIVGDVTGGHLSLTDTRLYFRAHRLNLKAHELSVPRADIVGLSTARSLGVLRNRLVVHLRDGRREVFVVSGLDAWALAIGRGLT